MASPSQKKNPQGPWEKNSTKAIGKKKIVEKKKPTSTKHKRPGERERKKMSLCKLSFDFYV